MVGPLPEPCWPKELKTLVGLEAACELSCEKLRAHVGAKAAVRGEARDFASGCEFRNRPEPVWAISRVREAISCVFGASSDDETRSSHEVPPSPAPARQTAPEAPTLT